MAVQRGRTEEVAVIVGPTVLGEIQLPLYLRGEEEFIANYQKNGAMLGSRWSNKSTTSPPIWRFYVDEG
jgi:hypothetical protein